jgi:DNA-binding NarL/FixJ family response regulator
MLRKLSKSNQDLTKRENEICDLMKQNICNRAISQRLTISERTTKFHVSNVLRKLKLSNRRQLWSLSTSSCLTYPEWLLPKDEAGLRQMRVFWETTALKTA